MNNRSRREKTVAIFEDLRTLCDTLISDVIATAKDVKPNRPDLQRSYVRTVFAMVEGLLNAMCDVILEAKETVGWPVTPKEEKVLCDAASEPVIMAQPSQGRKIFAPLHKRIKCAFSVSNRILGNNTEICFNGQAWARFLKALKIRDRLMHPKKTIDLDLTLEELSIVDSARDWFRFGVKRFFSMATDNFRSYFASKTHE